MRKLIGLALALPLLAALPAHAEWRAANPQVTEAARNPRIAAALDAAMRMDKAILTRDATAFAAVFGDDAVVNNPFNRIARKADAENNLRTGLIDYTTLTRSIEYAAVRGAHDVILMGEETLTPVGKAKMAGKTVRRRTTEIWSDASGQWKLDLRQATIYLAE